MVRVCDVPSLEAAIARERAPLMRGARRQSVGKGQAPSGAVLCFLHAMGDRAWSCDCWSFLGYAACMFFPYVFKASPFHVYFFGGPNLGYEPFLKFTVGCLLCLLLWYSIRYFRPHMEGFRLSHSVLPGIRYNKTLQCTSVFHQTGERSWYKFTIRGMAKYSAIIASNNFLLIIYHPSNGYYYRWFRNFSVL